MSESKVINFLASPVAPKPYLDLALGANIYEEYSIFKSHIPDEKSLFISKTDVDTMIASIKDREFGEPMVIIDSIPSMVNVKKGV